MARGSHQAARATAGDRSGRSSDCRERGRLQGHSEDVARRLLRRRSRQGSRLQALHGGSRASCRRKGRQDRLASRPPPRAFLDTDFHLSNKRPGEGKDRQCTPVPCPQPCQPSLPWPLTLAHRPYSTTNQGKEGKRKKERKKERKKKERKEKKKKKKKKKKIQSNGMEWNGMEWNGMESSSSSSNGIPSFA